MASWPWSRTATLKADTGGAEARKEAEENLRQHREQRVEVNRVAESLRALRLRNHFAEQIETAWKGQVRG